MRPVYWILLALAVLASGLYMARYGAPNLVGSGTAFTEKHAVSQLRTVHWAEGLFLGGAYDDADGDGAGEFGTMSQLAAVAPAGKPLPAPLIQPTGGRFVGDVLEVNGYCFAIALPASIDARERGFLAYAWPAQDRMPARAFCLDQDEVIRETRDRHPWVGCEAVPPEAACAGDAFRPWKNKRSRKRAGEPG